MGQKKQQLISSEACLWKIIVRAFIDIVSIKSPECFVLTHLWDPTDQLERVTGLWQCRTLDESN